MMPVQPEPPPEPPASTPLPPKHRRRLPLALLLLAVLALAAGSVVSWIVSRDLPDIHSLEDYQPPTITRILAADGRVVHQYADQKRLVVPLSAIDSKLIDGVIAVEDANFRRHGGVDLTAIARALLADVREGRWAEGGSTLTQQLTKILFLKPEKTLRRKVQEAILAMQIERTYTKEEILTFYLNQINFGHGRYGVEAASQFYFARAAANLTLEQAALLAGILNRPSTYSPLKNIDKARVRRNKVLDRMEDEKLASPQEAERARSSPLVLARTSATDETLAPWFAEEIKKQLTPKYGEESILRDGLVIQTGIDLGLQETAVRALSKGLRDLDKRRGFRRPARNIVQLKAGTLDGYQHPGWDRTLATGDLVIGLVMRVDVKQATVRIGRRLATLAAEGAAWTGRDDLTRLLRPGDLTLFEVTEVSGPTPAVRLDQEPEVEGAIVAIDPRTGEIRAMAGGYDFNRSQFNRASQAARQCGSAFKPFIYASAIADGRTPSELFFDAPTVFIDPSAGFAYQPENYERRYEGVVTMRRALEESINIPTVALLNEVGYARTVDFARSFGITSALHAYPSLALGASEVTLLQLTSAYGVFPSGGILSTPRYFSSIRDRNGTLLEERRPDSREVMRAEIAAVMVSMLEGVVQRGTAAAAVREGEHLGGKTGTTDEYTDAWFIGFSPSLVAGVWVGHDKKITLGPRETGARAALPIWSAMMDDWIARHPKETFPDHPDVVTLPVDPITGMRVSAEAGCRNVILESFVRGTEPQQNCTVQAHLRASLPYYLQRYRFTRDDKLEIPESELDRLLLENPFDLDLMGRTSLNVLTHAGVRMQRLARGSEGADLAWGLFRRNAPDVGDVDESADGSAQLLPTRLPPLDVGPHPHLGLDGRSAAVIAIRYQ